MSQDDMDICGSLWGHELAMRRLLLLLRQSQSQCNDVECFQPTQSTNDDDGFMVMTLCWMVLAFFLYFMRPASIRNRETKRKSDHNGNGSGGGGPNPPATQNAL